MVVDIGLRWWGCFTDGASDAREFWAACWELGPIRGPVVFNVLGMGRFTLRSDLPAYFQAFTNLDTAWAIVYLGLFSSVGAFFCMNYALPKLTPSKSAVFINLTQVISVLAGIFFRNEQFAPIQLLGVAIILAGVWGVNQGKKKAPANL